MGLQVAELWVRLKDGRSVRERYTQLEMAEFMREAMLDRLTRGEDLVCYDGEERVIPAHLVKRIDLLMSHEVSQAPAAVV